MTFELRDSASFSLEEREFDEMLLKLWKEVETGSYNNLHLLHFLKTWNSLEDEYWRIDSSIFLWMRDMREWVIREYIQAISFLWQDKGVHEIKLHIEHTFDNIAWININTAIETWRKQELTNLWKKTQQLVFNLIDAKQFLSSSEIVEFETAEEIFFFVLRLLGLEKLAAYLHGEGKRQVMYPLKVWEHDGIILICRYINNNHDSNDIIITLHKMWMPTNESPYSILSLWCICKEAWITVNHLSKIKLKQKNPC